MTKDEQELYLVQGQDNLGAVSNFRIFVCACLYSVSEEGFDYLFEERNGEARRRKNMTCY